MIKWLNFDDFWNAGATSFKMILAKKYLGNFFGSLGSFGSKLFFQSDFYEKAIFWLHGHFRVKELILIIFINYVLTCQTNMLTFALKKMKV